MYPLPDALADDEALILRYYRQRRIGPALWFILVPLGVAYYADTKWVLAVGIGLMLVNA